MSNPLSSNNNSQYLRVVPQLPSDRVLPGCDRHIPSREAMKKSSLNTYQLPPPQSPYEQRLITALVPKYSEKTFHYHPPKEYTPKCNAPEAPKWEYTIDPVKTLRILDFHNNFYTNNLDWGKSLLAVNGEKACRILDMTTSKVVVRIDFPNASDIFRYYSLKWSPSGSAIASGDAESVVRVFDPLAKKTLFNLKLVPHSLPIIGLSWKTEHELTVGCGGDLVHCDMRSKEPCLLGSEGGPQVLSLERSPDGTLLAASDYDNEVKVFDLRRTEEPLFNYSHLGSVKGLKWMPHSPFLLSGGGFDDKKIKVFNTREGKEVCEVDTGAQICSIESLSCNEFIIGTGYSGTRIDEYAANQRIQVWKFDRNESQLKKMHETFHTHARVISVSKDPLNSEFSSISTDGKLRIWNVKSFSNNKENERELFSSNPNLNGYAIR